MQEKWWKRKETEQKQREDVWSDFFDEKRGLTRNFKNLKDYYTHNFSSWRQNVKKKEDVPPICWKAISKILQKKESATWET